MALTKYRYQNTGLCLQHTITHLPERQKKNVKTEHTWTHLGCFWKLAKGAGVLFCPGDSETFCINSSQGIWWTRYIFQANATSDLHLIFWTTSQRRKLWATDVPRTKADFTNSFQVSYIRGLLAPPWGSWSLTSADLRPYSPREMAGSPWHKAAVSLVTLSQGLPGLKEVYRSSWDLKFKGVIPR